jgi:hypothetical protein
VFFVLFSYENVYPQVVTYHLLVYKDEEFKISVVPLFSPFTKIELNNESECLQNGFIEYVKSYNGLYTIRDFPFKKPKRDYYFKAIKTGECRFNVMIYRIFRDYIAPVAYAYELNVKDSDN